MILDQGYKTTFWLLSFRLSVPKTRLLLIDVKRKLIFHEMRADFWISIVKS